MCDGVVFAHEDSRREGAHCFKMNTPETSLSPEISEAPDLAENGAHKIASEFPSGWD